MTFYSSTGTSVTGLQQLLIAGIECTEVNIYSYPAQYIAPQYIGQIYIGYFDDVFKQFYPRQQARINFDNQVFAVVPGPGAGATDRWKMGIFATWKYYNMPWYAYAYNDPY